MDSFHDNRKKGGNIFHIFVCLDPTIFKKVFGQTQGCLSAPFFVMQVFQFQPFSQIHTCFTGQMRCGGGGGWGWGHVFKQNKGGNGNNILKRKIKPHWYRLS
jgi:hypothetical protein